MAQFLADIAGLLELFAIAGGLVLLHRASKEPSPAKLLKAAGWVLLIGGIVVGACTLLYWFKYQSRGDFDSVDMSYLGSMHGSGASMGSEVMAPGMGGEK